MLKSDYLNSILVQSLRWGSESFTACGIWSLRLDDGYKKVKAIVLGGRWSGGTTKARGTALGLEETACLQGWSKAQSQK
jgi:hypothetical protein